MQSGDYLVITPTDSLPNFQFRTPCCFVRLAGKERKGQEEDWSLGVEKFIRYRTLVKKSPIFFRRKVTSDRMSDSGTHIELAACYSCAAVIVR